MELLLGIVIFFVFIGAALKVGVVALKLVFGLLGILSGIFVLLLLIPLGIGLAAILLVPAIIIGVIVVIVKCIAVIF